MLDANESNYVFGPLFKRHSEIAISPGALKYYLKEDTDFMNKVDESGMTILHHIAMLGDRLSELSIEEILNKLDENNPNLNFSCVDNCGNTPLHIALKCFSNRTTATYLFPALAIRALELGFKFEIISEALPDAEYHHPLDYSIVTTAESQLKKVISMIEENNSTETIVNVSNSKQTITFYFDQNGSMIDAVSKQRNARKPLSAAGQI